MNPLDLRWQMVRDRWPLRVKNSSGSTIPPFSVVLVTTVTAVNNEMQYTVRQPNAASTDFNWNGYLVTGPYAIGAGSSNEGLATDLAQPNYVRYDTGTPAIGQIYGPKHGQLTLSKGYHGFEIMGGNTTAASNNVTIARWVGADLVMGKTDSSVTSGSTCTVSVYNGTTAGSETDTTMNLTSCYLRLGYVPTTCFVAVKQIGGLNYIVDDHRTVIGQADSGISKGSTGTFSIYNNGSDTGDNITVTATGAALSASKWATAWQEEKSATWNAACWEA